MNMNLNPFKNRQSETWERFSWFGKWERVLFPGDIRIYLGDLAGHS